MLSATSCSSTAASVSATRRRPPEKTLLKRIMLRLQDNRVDRDDGEGDDGTSRNSPSRCAAPLEEDSANFAMLKTVLNAVFVTTGLVLLISVIVVIIYTSIGRYRWLVCIFTI